MCEGVGMRVGARGERAIVGRIGRERSVVRGLKEEERLRMVVKGCC